MRLVLEVEGRGRPEDQAVGGGTVSSSSGRTVVPDCFRLAWPTACSSSRRLSWKRSDGRAQHARCRGRDFRSDAVTGQNDDLHGDPLPRAAAGAIIRQRAGGSPNLRAYNACMHKPVEAASGVVHAKRPFEPRCRRTRKAMTITLPAAAREPDHTVADGLPAERRRWAIAAIFTALAMASLDTAIANIALPAIAADLHVSPAKSVWVVNAYQIALVATLLPLARLAKSSATTGSISAACAVHAGLAGLRRGLVVAEPAGRTHAARPRRRRHHERQHRAGRFVYPGRMLGRGFGRNAMVVATAFTFGPVDRLRHPRGRAVAMAVRGQRSVRPRRDRHRP